MTTVQTLPLIGMNAAQCLSSSVVPPPTPWRWRQTWHDVFFAHWQIPATILRPHVPAGLAIDTWHGTAWVSLVAFRLDAQLWRLPNFGLTHNFVELNLRTYVRWRDQPGIQFLSIHAGRRVAVALARVLTPLPYVYAPLSYRQVDGRWRIECGKAKSASLLNVEFVSIGNAARPPGDSLDAWLVERYAAFAPNRRGQLCRVVVKHPPWEVQAVSARVDAANLGKSFGFDLHRQPDFTHFGGSIPAHLWPFERL